MELQVQQEKERLRKAIREIARNFPAEYIALSDRGILDNLLVLAEWKQAQNIFIYISIGREPDTRCAIQAALDAGKTVAVPRCLDGGVMEARVIESINDLQPGRFGSPEPDETYPLLSPQEIDLAVVPCMAADRQGYRLGHGGGYYDRYLATVHCEAVCLCREHLLQPELPHGALDSLVDIVITEKANMKIV
ncbi:MAG TPA: 5-formyltetrahydrofolate cyclo-ligase [Candidatus Limiplasma sp.]|nr:5-formyltetrahydrofolate cyclo-ligase [Candidatus Limiplasma sp.]